MIKKIRSGFLGLAIAFNGFSQKPAIVVGIVVDQMRGDYLQAFSDDFSDDGFKRLMEEGFYFSNTHYTYSATSTGPGHATIYTGTQPSVHGIIENEWYERSEEKWVNCVADEKSALVDGNEHGRSPKHLLAETIGEQLLLSTYGGSKVFSVGIKDRGAILPGSAAQLALWWDPTTAKWTTSTFYSEKLPKWVKKFNKCHSAKKYLDTWERFENWEGDYSSHDQYEAELAEDFGSAMPHDLKAISEKSGMSVLRYSPFGNTYTLDLAKKLIKAEKLHEGPSVNFLSVSLSSTDYIGHAFGPYSEEVRDTYIRLDRDLAEFLSYLDNMVGEGNYLIFLTSDHGVSPNIDYLKAQGEEAAWYDEKALKDYLSIQLSVHYDAQDALLSVSDGMIYLNYKAFLENVDRKKLQAFVAKKLMEYDGIELAKSAIELEEYSFQNFPEIHLQNSYHKGRSGDVLYSWKPYMRSNRYKKGTGHGTMYDYDTHVPLLFYGHGIQQGLDKEKADVTQIAPTLADLLDIIPLPKCTSASLTSRMKD